MGVGGVPSDLLVRRGDAQPGCPGRHQDAGDLLAAMPLPGHRGHGDQPGDVGAGVCDERLGAVDDPLVAVQHGGGRGPTGIGAGAGFGQPERAEHLPRGQLRQPLGLELLGAEPVDGHRAQAHARFQRDRHGGVDPGKFLDRHAQRHVVPAHPAVLLGEGQTEQAHLGHLLDDRVRELPAHVVVTDHRRHHVVGEFLDRLAQCLVLGGQS